MRALTNNVNNAPAEGGITIEEFLLMLEKVRQAGKNNWMARCPAHDDGRPSLRVGIGDKGILVNCFAGCTFPEIVGALGLNKQDLFFDALSSKNKALYQFRGAVRRRDQLDIYCSIYQSDLEKGKLTDEDRKRFQNYIAERNNLVSEISELRREYGFEDFDL